MSVTTLREVAGKYLDAGLSILPVSMPSKKPAVKSWKEYQGRFIDREDLVIFEHLDNGGVAVICGRISGNLEVLDFDNKLGTIEQTFKTYITTPAVKEIIKKYNLPYEKSPSGGYHIFYRSKNKVDGNKKLAERTKDGKKVCIIETRGEGGYVICSPTPGYKLLNGDSEAVPTIAPEERETLLTYAKSFGEMDVEDWKEVKLPLKGMDFIEAVEIRNILEAAGWKYAGKHLDNENYTRPGKRAGVSASFNGEVFYCFSSDAQPFEPMKGYNKFQVFTLLKYEGRVEEAKAEIYSRAGIVQEEVSKHFVQYVSNGSGFIPSIIEENYGPFLREKGIYRFDVGNDFKIVQIKNKVIREIQPHHVIDICRQGLDDALAAILLKHDARYFKGASFNHLDKFEGKIKQDTSTSSFLFFLDCWVEVKADDVLVYDYSELDSYIWEDQIIPHKFDIGEASESDFNKFLMNVTKAKESPERYYSLLSGIGYMLHRYKNPAVTKAFILCDEGEYGNLDPDSSQGGTGKSLICYAISKVRNTVKESGRTFNFDNTFRWQKVNPDTEVIWFDDTTKRFKFSLLFDLITGGIDVEKKNKSAFVIPFEESPKFLIATNYTISESDESTKRRVFEVELAPVYSAAYGPRDEFGKNFFFEWDDNEWRDFYTVMIQALQLFLKKGLLSYKKVNLDYRKLLQSVGTDFLDFFESYVSVLDPDFNGKVKLDRLEFYNKLSENKTFRNVYSRTSVNNIRKILEYYMVEYEERKSGEKRYFVFNNEKWRSEETDNQDPI